GRLFHATGRREEAKAALLQAVELFEGQSEEDCMHVPEYWHHRAIAYGDLALLLGEMGEYEEGDKVYRRAEAWQRRVQTRSEQYRDVPMFQDGLAESYAALVKPMIRSGHGQKAEECYTRAVTLRSQLAKHFKDEPHYQDRLAKCLIELGVMRLQFGR